MIAVVGCISARDESDGVVGAGSGRLVKLATPESRHELRVASPASTDTAPSERTAIPAAEKRMEVTATREDAPAQLPPTSASLELLSPEDGAELSDLLTFSWMSSPSGVEEILVCFGEDCTPSESIYRGLPPFQWCPNDGLPGRAGSAEGRGMYRWRVIDRAGRRSSGERGFVWTGGACGRLVDGESDDDSEAEAEARESAATPPPAAAPPALPPIATEIVPYP